MKWCPKVWWLLLTILLWVCNAFAVSPTPLSVQMYNGNTETVIHTIFPWFKITNTSTIPIDLSTVKIRYYYTIDGDKAKISGATGLRWMPETSPVLL